jgi:hypothetical protein
VRTTAARLRTALQRYAACTHSLRLDISRTRASHHAQTTAGVGAAARRCGGAQTAYLINSHLRTRTPLTRHIGGGYADSRGALALSKLAGDIALRLFHTHTCALSRDAHCGALFARRDSFRYALLRITRAQNSRIRSYKRNKRSVTAHALVALTLRQLRTAPSRRAHQAHALRARAGADAFHPLWLLTFRTQAS